MRALIVEDVPADAELITEQLRRDGFELDWVRVENEPAFRAALDPPPDVILSDFHLPTFGPTRAMAILRESGIDIPFIVVSGTIGEEAATEIMREGADDYVSKDKPARLGMAVSRAMAEADLRRGQARTLDDLRRAQDRFRGLFESKVIGILVANRTGQILEANSYFLSMVGRSPEDLPLDYLALTPDEDRSKDREVLVEMDLHGRAAPWEKEFINKAGNRVPTLMGGAKLPDESMVCFVVDLTQMKAVQANLENAKSQLEVAINQLRLTQDAVIAKERLHALGQMATGIAHDFNNNLSPIIGLSELILTRPSLMDDPEKVLKFVRTIHQAGRDAARVVSRLRDFYRPDSDASQTEVVSLKQVVELAIDLTRPRWGDQAMAEDTKYRIATFVQDVNVAGQASELREMLVNLIFNALDAMPDGGELGVTVDRDAGRPGMVSLEVTDTGVGMSPEVLKRCLEPFFTTKGASGTGLGLATTYGIVKRHQGEINIESELGHGTRVIVRLPIVRSRPALPTLREVRPAPAMHILVVDDEEMVRNVIGEYLRADGHNVDLAEGAVIALSKIKTGQYDLIITDRAMPDMSGDRLALEAKRLAPLVPILMLSGFGEFMNATGEHPEGVDAVVSKPITIDDLRDAIAMVTAVPAGRR
ncbi:MAG TPA: response regulator [Candidatus Dormibacteraeota bacterium]|jgi:PAS domain S-box-containing protein|nr:response regulator [Candidatus Dormibacteraeota bacterium]